MSDDEGLPDGVVRLPVENEAARAALHRMFQAFLDIAMPEATTVRDGSMLWLETGAEKEWEAERAVKVFNGLKVYLDVDLQIEVEFWDDDGDGEFEDFEPSCSCPVCQGFGPDGAA